MDSEYFFSHITSTQGLSLILDGTGSSRQAQESNSSLKYIWNSLAHYTVMVTSLSYFKQGSVKLKKNRTVNGTSRIKGNMSETNFRNEQQEADCCLQLLHPGDV